jgi:hypothetical protein
VTSTGFERAKLAMVRGALSTKLAVSLLPAALLVPLISSPLHGLTHLPGCRIEPGEPVTVAGVTSDSGEIGPDVAVSAISLEQPDPTETAPCPGIEFALEVGADSGGSTELTMPVTNTTSNRVTASAEVHLGAKTWIVRIGSMPPGGRISKTLTLPRSAKETTVSVGLLIGPA